MLPTDSDSDPAPERVSGGQALALHFESIENDQYDLNRRAASRAAGIADAIAYARDNPWIYALPGEIEPEVVAERCAVLEASLRLQLSTTMVRHLAHVAASARASLPSLWQHAREGFVDLRRIESVVEFLPRFVGAPEALRELDEQLAAAALTSSPTLFRSRVRTLVHRLAPQDPAVEHARAFAKRRVVVEDVGDGMSWMGAPMPTVDARAAYRRLRATAKGMSLSERDGRTRAQVCADLFSEWLRGVGTTTAVKTKVFVTVPLDRLGPKARASVRTDVAPAIGADLNADAQIVGDAPIDDATARRLLLEAGAFTRVITDPVTGVVLDMDRRSREVTRAQREWLALVHGTCTRDGCGRLAIEAEIDHWRAFHGPGRGPTDISNLHPFCEPEHKVKHKTRMTFRRRPDGSVQLISPTGYATAPAQMAANRAAITPEFLAQSGLETPLQRAARLRKPLPVDPPF